MAGDEVILEAGAPAIWFTFPGLWHDIGRFYLLDDTFTGYYTNIMTPVEFHDPLRWSTTDLFLDHWLDRKSTRLNSSHVAISYAVFCLKKKKTARRAGTRLSPSELGH